MYDDSGALVAKSGLTNFGEWSKERFGDNSPWGDVDSSAVVTAAELGPGAVGGERALLEGGKRTSTLRARTRARVAIAIDDEVDTAALQKLAQSHRREEQSTPQTRA